MEWITPDPTRRELPSAKIKQHQQFCKTTCVNCWHRNTGESAAMWKLYTGDHGIALVSNVGRLKQAFVDEPQTISIVNVEYRPDLETEPQFEGVEEFCRFKRSSFSHEQELRLVVLGDESVSANGGMYIAVDLAT